MNASLEAFRFDEAANALYAFFWSEFCDGYVEMVKPVLRDATSRRPRRRRRAPCSARALDSLALLHPFMPFVSCEIREALNGDGRRSRWLPFPAANAGMDDPLAVEAVETLRAVTTRIRNLRAERGLAQTEALAVGLEVPEGPLAEQLRYSRRSSSNWRASGIVKIAPKVDLAGGFRDVVAGLGVVVDLPRKEVSSEDRESSSANSRSFAPRRTSSGARLADESFLSRAPAAVIAKTKQQLEELAERHARLSGNLVGTPDA